MKFIVACPGYNVNGGVMRGLYNRAISSMWHAIDMAAIVGSPASRVWLSNVIGSRSRSGFHAATGMDASADEIMVLSPFRCRIVDAAESDGLTLDTCGFVPHAMFAVDDILVDNVVWMAFQSAPRLPLPCVRSDEALQERSWYGRNGLPYHGNEGPEEDGDVCWGAIVLHRTVTPDLQWGGGSLCCVGGNGPEGHERVRHPFCAIPGSPHALRSRGSSAHTIGALKVDTRSAAAAAGGHAGVTVGHSIAVVYI
ncbi:hypothetical protein B0H10DRAFT_1954417 [Mycena sp. CBHHK59/15]|nr:hypothetical protein B0H10DRAFT_1954417 [Mycena sp. CBHHK59/15]